MKDVLDGADGAGDLADALAGNVLERAGLEQIAGVLDYSVDVGLGGPVLGPGSDGIGGFLYRFAGGHHLVGGLGDLTGQSVQLLDHGLKQVAVTVGHPKTRKLIADPGHAAAQGRPVALGVRLPLAAFF